MSTTDTSNEISRSGTVIYVPVTLPGSTITVSQPATATPTLAVTTNQPKGLNAGEKAAIAVVCVFVTLLSVLLLFLWRRWKSAQDEECILSSFHTFSRGLVQTPTQRIRSTVSSSRFTASENGHGHGNTEAFPVEKDPAVFASSSEDGRTSTPPSSSPLLSPHSSMLPISPDSLMFPMPPITSTSPPAHPFAHMSHSDYSQLSPNSRRDLDTSLLPRAPLVAHLPTTPPTMPMPMPMPMLGFPLITSSTTAASERSPHAWDNPPPSSEYLPGTSRRTTFRTSRYVDRGLDLGLRLELGSAGYPSPPYAMGTEHGAEDARSERIAPPSYSRD